MRSVTEENYQNQKEYPGVVAVVAQVLARQRWVAPVEVFLGMGLLRADDLARWRRGEVQYLERVLRCNLSKASAILRILRFHAHDLNLGASMTVYKHRSRTLRFSKTGARPIEEAYARHFVVIGKKNPFEATGKSLEASSQEVSEESSELPSEMCSWLTSKWILALWPLRATFTA
jgi:hypothetical protein